MSIEVKSVTFGNEWRVNLCVDEGNDPCSKIISFVDKNRDAKFDYMLSDGDRYEMSDESIQYIFNEVKPYIHASVEKAKIVYRDMKAAVNSGSVRLDTTCKYPRKHVRPFFTGIGFGKSFYFSFEDLVNKDGIFDTVILSDQGVQYLFIDSYAEKLDPSLKKLNERMSIVGCQKITEL